MPNIPYRGELEDTNAILVSGGKNICGIFYLHRCEGDKERLYVMKSKHAIGKRITGDGAIKNRNALIEYLEILGVIFHTSSAVCEVGDGEITVNDLIQNVNMTYAADLMVRAMGYRPDDSLTKQLEKVCCKVIAIGDCTGTGNIVGATTGAYEAVWNL